MGHCGRMNVVGPPLWNKVEFCHAKELEIRAERLERGIGGQRT